MIVPTRIVGLFSASAITVFPFILVYPGELTPELMAHEGVHYAEQRRWALYGLGIGLLVWFALYLLALPALWNPLRRGTETRAYLAQGFSEERIRQVLRERPYWLWF
jgi:ABC-type multidrug transport system permease subunit